MARDLAHHVTVVAGSRLPQHIRYCHLLFLNPNYRRMSPVDFNIKIFVHFWPVSITYVVWARHSEQGPDNAFLLGLQQGITKMMVEAASTSPLPLLHRG